MPLRHYFDAVLNPKTGAAIEGALVRVFDSGGALVDIYADENSTAIETVSGVENAAVTDEDGMFSFYVADGEYSIAFYSSEEVPLKSIDKVDLGVEVTHSELEAATGAALIGTSGGATVQDEITARPTSITLAGATGAALIGTSDGETVQQKLDGLDGLEDLSAIDVSNVNFIGQRSVAKVNPLASSSVVLGGTSTQPNYLGKLVHREIQTGDGGAAYTIGPMAFTLADPGSRLAVRAVHVRASDKLILSPSVTVASGYGTDTLSVTLSTVIPTTDRVEFVVYSVEDDPALTTTDLTLNAVGPGYDSSVGSIASQVESHHSIDMPGTAGHNTIKGGSYHRTNGSYNAIYGGSRVWIGMREESIGVMAMGRDCELDGTDAFAAGFGHDINGGRGWIALGRDSESADLDDVILLGRRPKGISHGEMVHACGRSTDAVNGAAQVRRGVLAGQTTNTTITSLRITTGASSITIPDDSAAVLSVSVVGRKEDGTKVATFRDSFVMTKLAGTAKINDSTADVAITSVGTVGANTYAANVRALSGALVIRVAGDTADETVNWTGSYEITENTVPAAA